jgi:hypothetical protein
MCGIGNYGAASEFHEARQDFREARQETREARQHFAEAREQFSEARQDFARGNILGGIAHTIAGRRELAEGRQDLADARQARSEGFQHLAQGCIDQTLGFGGFGSPGALGGFFGGLGPNIDPGLLLAGLGGSDGPSSGATEGTEGLDDQMFDPTVNGLFEADEEGPLANVYAKEEE